MEGGDPVGAEAAVPIAAETRRVIIWDVPVRLVHWAFVLLLPALWWTADEGEMDWHRRLAYVMLALVVFRLLWGFVGSVTARFSQFVKGPKGVLSHLRGRSEGPIIGHNPLGGWSVLLLLGLLTLQVSLGLFATDSDGLESGPLAQHVSFETSDAAADAHELVFNTILGAVALHVAAILYYLLAKRDNLVGPMISGRKAFGGDVAEPMRAPLWRALVVAALAAGLAWWISLGAPF